MMMPSLLCVFACQTAQQHTGHMIHCCNDSDYEDGKFERSFMRCRNDLLPTCACLSATAAAASWRVLKTWMWSISAIASDRACCLMGSSSSSSSSLSSACKLRSCMTTSASCPSPAGAGTDVEAAGAVGCFTSGAVPALLAARSLTNSWASSASKHYCALRVSHRTERGHNNNNLYQAEHLSPECHCWICHAEGYRLPCKLSPVVNQTWCSDSGSISQRLCWRKLQLQIA